MDEFNKAQNKIKVEIYDERAVFYNSLIDGYTNRGNVSFYEKPETPLGAVIDDGVHYFGCFFSRGDQMIIAGTGFVGDRDLNKSISSYAQGECCRIWVKRIQTNISGMGGHLDKFRPITFGEVPENPNNRDLPYK